MRWRVWVVSSLLVLSVAPLRADVSRARVRLARAALREASVAAREIRDPDERRSHLLQLPEALARIDPFAGLALARNLSDPSDRRYAARQVFRVVLERDLESADKLRAEIARDASLAGLVPELSEMAETARVAQQTEWQLDVPAGEDEDLLRYARAKAGTDTTRAWEAAQRVKDPATRDQALYAVATGPLPRTAGAVQVDQQVSAAYTIHDAPLRSKALSHAIMRLATSDPDLALVRLGLVVDPDQHDEVLGCIVQSLAEGRQPARAIDLIHAMRGHPGREGVVVNAIKGIARVDPERAFALLEELPYSPARRWALLNLVSGGAEEDLDRMLAFVSQRLRGEDLSLARGALAPHLARAGRLGQAWEFALAAGDEEQRASAVGWVATVMARTDPQGALARVARLGDQSLRDAAFRAVAPSLAWRDPDLGLRTAQRVRDPVARCEALVNVAKECLRE